MPVLGREVLEAGILAVHGRGVHFALLYATMRGFKHETLAEPEAIQELGVLIQEPPEFTEDGVRRAVSRVLRDADSFCKSGTLDLFVYGAQNQNLHLRSLLDPYQQAIKKYSAQQVFWEARFDIGAFIKKIAVERRERDLDAILRKLDEKREYLAPLLMRALANGRNKYGDQSYEDFFSELVEFLTSYFRESDLPFFGNYHPLRICLNHVKPWLVKPEDVSAMPTDGIDFEHWCAAQLETQGWKVRVSKASGDQGVDIEAMGEGMLIAIQCKRYNHPVGNKSVQEVYTGATHYRADKAVVIGTGGFTPAAIELAANTGVILIDAQNIAAFTGLVTGSTHNRAGMEDSSTGPAAGKPDEDVAVLFADPIARVERKEFTLACLEFETALRGVGEDPARYMRNRELRWALGAYLASCAAANRAPIFQKLIFDTRLKGELIQVAIVVAKDWSTDPAAELSQYLSDLPATR